MAAMPHLKGGDAAGFKANSRNGHQGVNRGSRDAGYLKDRHALQA